jgi:hypothetical protein
MSKLGSFCSSFQCHINLVRDLSGDFMVCQSRNETKYSTWYLQGDRNQVGIAEAQVEDIVCPVKSLETGSLFEHLSDPGRCLDGLLDSLCDRHEIRSFRMAFTAKTPLL